MVDYLYDEMGWRKKELSGLYTAVQLANDKKLPTALRCAVVMLYAHWEGYIKNASEAYVIYVQQQGLNLDQLNTNLLALSLRKKINDFLSSQKATLHVSLVDFMQKKLGEKATFGSGAINTKSNLDSQTLAQIFAAIGIEIKPYELKSNLIDTQLLRYRNNIAHGTYLSLDKKEYEALHSEIIGMLNQIHTDISNSALLGLYKK